MPDTLRWLACNALSRIQLAELPFATATFVPLSSATVVIVEPGRTRMPLVGFGGLRREDDFDAGPAGGDQARASCRANPGNASYCRAKINSAAYRDWLSRCSSRSDTVLTNPRMTVAELGHRA